MCANLVDILAKHAILYRIVRVLERTREARAFCGKDVNDELVAIEGALEALEEENARQIDQMMARRYANHNYSRRAS